MMKNYKQSGFYLVETLISLQIFFISVFTLFPIQHQVSLEKKMLKEKDKVVYFLSGKIKEAIVSPPEKHEYIYEDVIQTPITITFTKTESLLKGCVEWVDAKQNEDRICLFVKEE